VIRFDFCDMCQDFFLETLCMQSINNSYITLVPKIDQIETINDYKPISLLNSFVKLLTKLVADRLQQVIIQLVHENQYRFIKSRSIQDRLLGFLNICTYVIKAKKIPLSQNWTLKRHLTK
jgi:hypothetical protein